MEDALEKATRSKHTLKHAAWNPALEPGARTRSSLPGAAGVISHPLLVVNGQNHSPVFEEYKKLKAKIMKMTKQDPFRNVILVTSSVGGEGKTLTAANLALSLSQDYDHSVLLIDADTRKPTLHTLFNLHPKTGLSECLAEGADIGSALIRIGRGDLTFLPSGKRPDNPVELFSSQKMKTMLAELKSRYPNRYIIIDSPPSLLFAETKILSALVDGIVFVIREGRAPLHHIIEAFDSLKEEQILGIVYNDAGPDGLNGRYSYYGYYDHYK